MLRAATEYSIVCTDLRGVIDVFNDGAERMLGYARDEVLDRATPLLFHDAAEIAARAAELGMPPGFEVFVHEARVDHAETREWTYVRKDGGRLPVSLTVTAMHDDAGALIGYVGIARDLTAEKAAEAQRREIERWKDEFLANVSHDLKTPITAVRASIGVVIENEPSGTTEGHRRMFRNIAQAADRMSSMVDDLIELNRLRLGHTRLSPEPCDLRDVAQRAARIVEPLAQARNQRVSVKLPRRPVMLAADVTRLERAVLNLLGNAHKHGREGGEIVISVDRTGTEAQVTVSDDGPGIPPSERERIFERFYRVEGGASLGNGDSKPGGSGLGLPIARRLVELHGGRLTLECRRRPGATFRITLPATAGGASSAATTPTTPTEGLAA
ncbi:MAG TPA: PAS domain-containing sensor histidine kinase [Chloroflexota bacterium]|nr:PAS domain-containing sensor histidine kinase [Chloroflexota bacterium]